MAASALLSGILIDLDHIVDYMIEFGPRFDRKQFFDYFYKKEYRRVVLVFHGWEWLLFLGVLAWQTGWNPWYVGLLAGIGHHLVLDQLANSAKPLGYSVLWRWLNGFRASAFLAAKRG
jgi:hypothetical protein